MKKLYHIIQSTEGNTSVLFALAAIPLLAAAGVAVDMVHMTDIKTDVADALDAAVLAGTSSEGDHLKAAEIYFKANFSEGRVSEIKTTFKLEDDYRVVGLAEGKLKAGLTAAIGYEAMSFKIEATADREEGKSKLCVLALAPNTSQSLLINSGAEIKATDCEIHVKSVAMPAAILNAGINVDTDKICIAGHSIIDNVSLTRNVETSCDAQDNPYAGKFPVPASTSCNYSNLNYSGKTTLSPGVYCGWHNFNSGSDVDLEPGVYIIKDGGWNVNGGNWKGTGVTFYYADTSKIQFNSAVKASLKAPTSGNYKGLLFGEKEGLSDSQFVLDDSLGFDMEGIIYLPSRELVVNSGTSMHSQFVTVVVRTIIFNTSRWHLKNYDEDGSGEKYVRLVK